VIPNYENATENLSSAELVNLAAQVEKERMTDAFQALDLYDQRLLAGGK
jgi:hypothetical protein